MKDKPVRILSTRPIDTALIEKAAYQNVLIDTIAFINIKRLVTENVARRIDVLAKQKTTVVFTSANAVDIVVDMVPVNPLMPDWKIYCIGGATFTLVKKYWPYGHVAYTSKNATEIAEGIISNNEKEVIFFCGIQRREELPELLRQNNVRVEELAIYETLETPSIVKEDYEAVMFFSPSAVSSFFTYNTPPDQTILFAIGNTTANAIKKVANNRVVVSDFPSKDQLVDKTIKYFSKR